MRLLSPTSATAAAYRRSELALHYVTGKLAQAVGALVEAGQGGNGLILQRPGQLMGLFQPQQGREGRLAARGIGAVVLADDLGAAFHVEDVILHLERQTDTAGVGVQRGELLLVGLFAGQRAELQRFLTAGCRRVLVSHPANSAADVDATVVYGINHDQLDPSARIVSNASCTTNAIVPVLALLDEALGLDQVLLTTLHAAMNDQPLIDGYHHHDLRRTRSAMQSIIPVATGLARGVERLLPQLADRVQARAIRVPTHNVSAIELVVSVRRDISREALNTLLREATHMHPGRLDYSDDAHASIDFNHDPHSAIIDGSQTTVSGGRLLHLLVWFDNEWGFANRMVDVARHWLTHLPAARS